MSAVTRQRSGEPHKARDGIKHGGPEFYPPAHVLLDLPRHTSLPSDPVESEITILLHERPYLCDYLGDEPLGNLTSDEKKVILARIKEAYGVRPFRRRNLG